LAQIFENIKRTEEYGRSVSQMPILLLPFCPMISPISEDLTRRLKAIKLFVLDVDGTLTDGGIFIDSEGQEFKRFDAHDGHGIKVLMSAGVDVAFLSGRDSRPVELRAKALGVKTVLQGHFEKSEPLLKLMYERGLAKEEVAVMGDDTSDLGMARVASVSFAPANAIEEVKEKVDFVTSRFGGYGAVREACDMILKARS
jgi:3-deoxy-D-manno-octulosonate 8-phosphate phosphatase (KDO 8-P phosphatase)